MLEHEHNQLKIHLDEHEEDFLALSLEVPADVSAKLQQPSPVPLTDID
jgi:hypothetical protein